VVVARDLVVQQLTINNFDQAELSALGARIKNRLVLNLSSISLTPDQLSLLQLGIGFRLNFLDASDASLYSDTADCAIQRLALALRNEMSEQRDVCEQRTTVCHSLNPTPFANPKRELLDAFSSTYKHLLPSLREHSDDILGDVDVVSNYLLNQLSTRLRLEFQNADGDLSHNLSIGQATALQQLRRLVTRRQIIIRKADKSRQICILDPTKYDRAVMVQLSDTSNYQPTPFNMKHKCAALIKQCVGKFLQKKLLTQKQAETLLLYTDKPSTRYFYGLPKTHKPTAKWTDGMPPLRPICPDLRTETTASGCFIAQYLKQFMSSIKSYCKNSYMLKDLLLDAPPLGPDAVLLTSDVDSLYPSIPISQALHRVVRKLNNKAPEFQLVVELLRIQLAHNYFSFQDKSFQQIRGIPMGKAWAPVVACIYMEEWECSLWKELGAEPLIYVRYIDDIFAVFQCRADADKFLIAAAARDPNIRLSETNVGNSVHFLDLQISLNDRGRFETSIYRKESDLIVLLHHKSAHTTSVKDGVILSQLRRFLRLHTNYTEAGRCMYVFMRLMVQLRGLSPRRARFLWSTFKNKIRSGSILLGRQPARTNQDVLRRNDTVLRFSRSIRIPVPPTVRRKRIHLILDDFLNQLNAQQRARLRSMVLCNSTPPPLGVTLFRR
jgi:hypothetical protein